MSRPVTLLVIAALLCLLLVPVASAHAPQFPSGNDGLDRAMEVHDPTKSWAIYNALPDGRGAHYYSLEMRAEDKIKVMLTVPRSSIEEGFLPSIVVMGPGISENGTLPTTVERPDGAGAWVVPGTLPEHLEYEPFSPSSFYEVAEVSIPAPSDGTYYLAVFDQRGGQYGAAIGAREAFTIDEWLLIPFYSFRIYLWEGQTVPQVLAPPIAVLAVTMAAMLLMARKRSGRPDVMWLLLTVSGSLMMASAALLISQMLHAIGESGLEATAVVTAMIAAVGALLGLSTLRIAHGRRGPVPVRPKTRAWLIVIFLLGLVAWAGWIVGPVLALIVAVLPDRLLRRHLIRR